jgi:hypothetical protein
VKRRPKGFHRERSRRAHIRLNRRELETAARSGAFGPIVEEKELRVAIAGDDERDDGEVCNPSAGASWLDNRTTPLRRQAWPFCTPSLLLSLA